MTRFIKPLVGAFLLSFFVFSFTAIPNAQAQFGGAGGGGGGAGSGGGAGGGGGAAAAGAAVDSLSAEAIANLARVAAAAAQVDVVNEPELTLQITKVLVDNEGNLIPVIEIYEGTGNERVKKAIIDGTKAANLNASPDLQKRLQAKFGDNAAFAEAALNFFNKVQNSSLLRAHAIAVADAAAEAGNPVDAAILANVQRQIDPDLIDGDDEATAAVNERLNAVARQAIKGLDLPATISVSTDNTQLASPN